MLKETRKLKEYARKYLFYTKDSSSGGIEGKKHKTYRKQQESGTCKIPPSRKYINVNTLNNTIKLQRLYCF